jgi:hypothetical protein
MKDRINVAELLRNCPKGMELDCIMLEGSVVFEDISEDDEYPIGINLKNGDYTNLTKYGQYLNLEEAKCVIFPKGKTTWEGFVPPYKFKEGDILTTRINSIFIFSHLELDKNCDRSMCKAYVGIRDTMPISLFRAEESDVFGPYESMCKLATEKEKEKLFQAIKDNGYRWNPETKTLEELPKFKTGDRIKLKGGDEFGIITEVADCFYTIKNKNHTHCWPIKKQDDWELVPDKFDITTLKPFDKVLVRNDNKHVWEIQFFERLNNILKDSFVCMGRERYHQCIPYEGNEHLHNTAKDCDEYFKTWG